MEEAVVVWIVARIALISGRIGPLFLVAAINDNQATGAGAGGNLGVPAQGIELIAKLPKQK